MASQVTDGGHEPVDLVLPQPPASTCPQQVALLVDVEHREAAAAQLGRNFLDGLTVLPNAVPGIVVASASSSSGISRFGRSAPTTSTTASLELISPSPGSA